MKTAVKTAVILAICIDALAASANDTDYGPFGSSDDWTYESGNKDRTATPVIGLSSGVYIGARRAAEGDCIAAYRKDKNVICGLGRVDAYGKTGIKFEVASGVKVHFRLWVASSGTASPRIYDLDAACDFTIPSTDLPTVDMGDLTVTLQKTFMPGEVSRFSIDGVGRAVLVGASEVAWRDFSSTDYYGVKTFVDQRIVDAEKTSAADNDDYWCYPMSDMDALYITGWASKTPYASVDDMVSYFRKNPKLLRYEQTAGNMYTLTEGTYGYDGMFDWYADTTGLDLYGLGIVEDGTADAEFASGLSNLMDDGNHVVRLNVGFDEVLHNKKWKGIPTLHGVLCVGYVADGDVLKALFIIDPDNNQYTGNGGASAPNSIMYCPVRWDTAQGAYIISGVWGQDGVIESEYRSISMKERDPEVYTVTFIANGGTGTMVAQKFTESVEQALTKNTFTKAECEFAGWKDQYGNEYGDEEEIAPTENLTLTAQWKIVPRIAVSPEGREHGWHAVDGASFTITCNTGWSAAPDVGWITSVTESGTGNGTVSYSLEENTDTEPRSGKITVKTDDGSQLAEFAVTQRGWSEGYLITFLPGDGGSGYMDSQEFDDGVAQRLSFNRFEMSGHVFWYWKDQNGVTYDDCEEIAPIEDLTLTAQWTQWVNVYAAAWPEQSGAKGSVTKSPKQDEVKLGTTVSLTAKPSNSKTVFAYWEDADGNVLTSADGTHVGFAASLKVAPDALTNDYWARFRLKSACKRPVFEAGNPYGDGFESANSMVGVAYKAQIVVNEDAYPVKFSATGLPKGLKINAATGVISGVPTKAGTFKPTITVKSAANSKLKASSVRLTMTVAGLPAWARGTFNGRTFSDDENVADGSTAITVGSTGKISGKIVLGGTNWTVSVSSYSVGSSASDGTFLAKGTASAVIGKTTYKMPWSWTVEKPGGVFKSTAGEGTLGAVNEFGRYPARWIALRSIWKDSGAAALLSGDGYDSYGNWTGAYIWDAPDGKRLTLTVAPAGTVKVAGTLANGRKLSISAPLIYLDDEYVTVVCAPKQTVTTKDKKGKVVSKVTYPAFFAEVSLVNEPGTPVAGEFTAYRKPGVRAAVDEYSTGTGAIKYSASYGQAVSNSTVTVTATAAKKCVFAYWRLDGDIVSYSASYKVKMSNEDITGLTAVFRKTSDFKANPEMPYIEEDTFDELRVGIPFRAKIEVDSDCRPVKFVAKNLPAGLKLNATTGVISGVPTAAGAKTISITATSVANTKLVSPALKIPVSVAKLDAWAKGTFTGKGDLNGKTATATLTVGATGKISGKFTVAKKSYAFTATSYSVYDGYYEAKAKLTYGKTTYPVVISVDLDGESNKGFAYLDVMFNDDREGQFGAAEVIHK